MTKNLKARVSQFGLVLLAIECLGADGGCGGGPDYGDVTDVRIYQGSALFLEQRVDNRRTHGWNEHDIFRRTTPSSTGTAHGELTGLAPRELFVFNLSMPTPNTDNVGQFYSDLITASATPTTKANLSKPIKAARLIDHGACRESFPFQTSDGKGLFDVFNARIQTKISEKIKEGGADPVTRAAAFQAHFWKLGETTVDVADGFSLAFWFSGELPTIFVPDVEISFGADYAFGLERGFLSMRNLRMRVNVFDPYSKKDAGLEIGANLQETLPKAMRATAMYGTPDGTTVPPSVAPMLTICEGQPEDFCARPSSRKTLVGLVNRTLSEADATALVNSLPADGFECRHMIDGADDQAGESAYERCYWHPTFRRVNVLPDGFELVWYDVGETESPDLRVLRLLTPNKSLDCAVTKPARFPKQVGVAGLTEGDIDALMDRLHD